MGATVVNALTASHWAGHKPAAFKNMDLDRALQAYEAQAGKNVATAIEVVPPQRTDAGSAPVSRPGAKQ